MIVRATSANLDFRALVRLLDQYLAQIDGSENSFYSQFNGIDSLQNCILLYENNSAIGCGAIKRYNDESYEVKRMFVHPDARGQGSGQKIVMALEKWAKELGAAQLILETGKRMPDAVQLYKKMGYRISKNYPPYIGVDNSICFSKILS